MKKKYLFVGDPNSINLELIFKSHKLLMNKVKYIILGNFNDLEKYKKIIKSKISMNEIYDPINFEKVEKKSLNIFNIENVSKIKYENLLNQIEISNYLSNKNKINLVTMPINKSVFKKKIRFNGMTEHLSKLNNKSTLMLMHGERFSIIPLTTHINLKDVSKHVKKNILIQKLKNILFQINRKSYNLNFKEIRFLCYNPHCSEDNTLGFEDKIIYETISKFRKIKGMFAADSAFKDRNIKDILFISMYHDQALIPFKILNKKGINLTLGLNYKRMSPAHGTAKNIKYKNTADNSSFIACMEH